MKKRILLIILSIFGLIFATNKVEALELNSNGTYTNLNGIVMTNEQIENLKSLAFTDKQIYAMDREEFEANKNLHGEIVSQIVKYYKTITINNTNIISSTGHQYLPISETYEITEEEYNRGDETLDKTNSSQDGVVTTEYKKMTTTIIKNGSYYRYKNDLQWRKMPKVRSYDIQSIGIDTNVSVVPSSKKFTLFADIKDNDNKVCVVETSSSGTWNVNSLGALITFPLKSDTSSKKVFDMSSTMYFDVQKTTNVKIVTLNAYGNYKHAQKKVDSSVGGGVSVGLDGTISFGISVSTTTRESYDSMSTAQAVVTGISW